MTARTPNTYHIPESATPRKVVNACPTCGGLSVIVRPGAGVDACPRCAAIAEVEWRMTARKQQTTNNISKRNAA